MVLKEQTEESIVDLEGASCSMQRGHSDRRRILRGAGVRFSVPEHGNNLSQFDSSHLHLPSFSKLTHRLGPLEISTF